MATPVRDVHALKKLDKKMRKIEKILSSKEHLVISKQPTQVLCVQNGGLENNISQAELLPLFAAFGNVDGIIMIPRKQYCFVSFTDVACASEAVHHLSGHLLRKGKDPTQDVVLYLLYVEKAPSSMMPSSEKPQGLHIVEDFVSEEIEEALLSFIENYIGDKNKDTGVMKHRQVKHFGFEFKYDINDVDIKNPLPDDIPPLCHDLLHRAKSLGLIDHCPDQLTVNQYKPGQGIPPHVDTVDAFEDGIISLSLGSQTVMDFRHPDGQHLVVPVPRRSLLIMTGDSRYVWSHGITPRKSDIIQTPNGNGLTLQNRGVRTSFTFRKVVMNRRVQSLRKNDKDITLGNLPGNDAEAIALEKHHVHKVYDDIAEHFSGTRYKPWPNVAEFMNQLPSNSLVADVGCGNGKCLGINKQLFEIGCDYSSNLASICGSRGFETCVADVTCLPFRSNTFDVVLCIAVVHHMSTKERRAKAISEVLRILHPGGKALIYVWAMEQDYEKNQSKYININRQKKLGTFEDGVSTFAKETHLDLTETFGGNNNTESGDVKDVSMKDKMGIIENHPFHQNSAEESSLTVHSINIRRMISEVSTEHSNILVRNEDTNPDNSDQKLSQVSSQHTKILVRNEDINPDNSDQKLSQVSSEHTKVLVRNEDINPDNSKQKLHLHVNRTQFKEQDMLVPWQLKCRQSSHDKLEEFEEKTSVSTYHRFYHVFRQGELEAVCKKVSGCVVKRSYYDQGNWCAVLEKL